MSHAVFTFGQQMALVTFLLQPQRSTKYHGFRGNHSGKLKYKYWVFVLTDLYPYVLYLVDLLFLEYRKKLLAQK